MFLTLTPNPCLEKTFFLPDFGVGESVRVENDTIYENLGGKGINAARVATLFGRKSMAIAPVGAAWLTLLLDMAARENVSLYPTDTQIPTRLCQNIVGAKGQLTQILEAGYALSLQDGTRLFEAWRELLPSCDLCAIGGSYPTSEDPSWTQHAAILVQMANAAGKRLVYDGKGAPFRRAVFSQNPPWAIKPNLEEARELLHQPIEDERAERAAIRALQNRGVEVVLLSCGARGLYVGFGNDIEFFAAPPIELVCAVGSGDALVGAFVAKYLETGDVFESAKWGVAAGTVNAAKLQSAFVSPEECEPLLDQITRKMTEIRLL